MVRQTTLLLRRGPEPPQPWSKPTSRMRLPVCRGTVQATPQLGHLGIDPFGGADALPPRLIGRRGPGSALSIFPACLRSVLLQFAGTPRQRRPRSPTILLAGSPGHNHDFGTAVGGWERTVPLPTCGSGAVRWHTSGTATELGYSAPTPTDSHGAKQLRLIRLARRGLGTQV